MLMRGYPKRSQFDDTNSISSTIHLCKPSSWIASGSWVSWLKYKIFTNKFLGPWPWRTNKTRKSSWAQIYRGWWEKNPVQVVRKKPQAIEKSNKFRKIDVESLGFVSNLMIPHKFKVLNFDKYNKTMDPSAHIRMYYKRWSDMRMVKNYWYTTF